MIIKSLSRKGNKRSTVKQLLTYMFQEHKKSDFVLTHNLQGNNIVDFTNAFMLNEKNRLHIRKNNVLVYHDMISMHHLDSEKITQKTLRNIAKEYIKLRNPNALYVILPHYDRHAIHLHIAISGIEQHTGLSTRISKERFKEIKIELQNMFPELEHSIVEHGKKDKQKISEREYQMMKRKTPTEKEYIKQLLETLYKESTSQEDFYKRIQDNGLKTYERRGKKYGIDGNRKMRFSTLGFDDKKIKDLDVLLDFTKLRDDNNRGINKTYYYVR